MPEDATARIPLQDSGGERMLVSSPEIPSVDVSRSIASGETADVYFSRSQEILRLEGLNPLVTVEIFPSRRGMLCGIGEVIDLLRDQLGCGTGTAAEVWALAEGERFDRKEVVLRITARYRPLGLFETAILGMLSQSSGWATASRECVEAAGGIPVVSYGARHVHPRVAGIMDYAAIVGGCVSCSTTAGARLAGLSPSGTMPHALILIFGDTVEAALAFDRHMPPDVPRVVLADTFRDEADESLRVASELGDRLWGIRLDTPSERGGVTADLVKEVRARLDQAGFPNVRIVISGGLSPERIRYFRENDAQVDGFGVGSYVSSSSPIDFTCDIKQIEDRPIAKRGRIPGITPNPRLRRVEL